MLRAVRPTPGIARVRPEGRVAADDATGAEILGEQVSSLADVRLPQMVALHASYSTRTHSYHLVGKATADGRGAPGVVRIYRSVGGGPFVTRGAVVRFRAHFTASPDVRTDCGKDVNGVPCVTASSGGWEKDSNVAFAHA